MLLKPLTWLPSDAALWRTEGFSEGSRRESFIWGELSTHWHENENLMHNMLLIVFHLSCSFMLRPITPVWLFGLQNMKTIRLNNKLQDWMSNIFQWKLVKIFHKSLAVGFVAQICLICRYVESTTFDGTSSVCFPPKDFVPAMDAMLDNLAKNVSN